MAGVQVGPLVPQGRPGLGPPSLPRKDVTERTFSRFDAGLHRILCLHPHMKKKQADRSEEHTSELQSQSNLVCRLLLEKKKNKHNPQLRVASDTTDVDTSCCS